METGIDATLRLLTRTRNQAAVDVLVAALGSETPATRLAALAALLERPDPAGHREVFRRIGRLDEAARAVLRQRPDRLLPVALEALRAGDAAEAEYACRVIVEQRIYDAVGPLVALVADSDHPGRDLAAQTTLRMAECLYAELCESDAGAARDYDAVRGRLTGVLEDGVRKYARHLRVEIVEALLLVAKPTNAVVRSVLLRPEEKSHEAMREILATSQQGGVLRLLLGFLEDPQSPRAALDVLAGRADARFVEHFLRAVGRSSACGVIDTLRRIDRFAWAVPGHEVFGELSEEAQVGAIQAMFHSGMKRDDVVEMLGYLLLEGKPGARRAAAAMLARFDTPLSDALVVRGLADPNPAVRAELIVQLRPRGIPNALSLLIRMVDSSDESVRAALRQALPEFTLRQFLQHFDHMDESLRPLAGHMVVRLEPGVERQLAAEMECVSPVRRRRAVRAAKAMGVVEPLELVIAKLLGDADHMVRVAAAEALAEAKSAPTWEALCAALFDRSMVVQEAAEQSLKRISRSLSPTAEEETIQEVAT